ncbi:MAG: hypothetical protein K5906_00265 [Bacilli bacterium]|nr:hypothetical protein [Bacilli bacterium]
MKTKKLDDLTKVKLIYSGELIVIAIVALVIGILQLSNVITIKELFRNIFNWVTIFGGPIFIIHTLYSFINKEKRKKFEYFDKLTTLPLIIYILVIDIICFVNYGSMPQEFYQTYIPIALVALGVIYLAQGIYHWFHPLQSLLDELEQERIDAITYKVLEKNEDGSIRCLHIEDNKEFLFKETDIKENKDELFCLDQYPNAKYEEIIKEEK